MPDKSDEPKLRTTIILNREQIQRQIDALNEIQAVKDQLNEIAEKIEKQIETTDYFLGLMNNPEEGV